MKTKTPTSSANPQNLTQPPAQTSNVSPAPKVQIPPVQSSGATQNTPLILTPPEFEWKEFPTGTGQIKTKMCMLRVSRAMKKRKLYCWFYTENGANPVDNGLRANVVIVDNNNIVRTYPIGVGISQTSGSVVTFSMMNLLTYGGNIGPDSLYFIPQSPTANQPTSVILQPLRFKAEMTELYIEITDMVNIIGNSVRCVLACVSSY